MLSNRLLTKSALSKQVACIRYFSTVPEHIMAFDGDGEVIVPIVRKEANRPITILGRGDVKEVFHKASCIFVVNELGEKPEEPAEPVAPTGGCGGGV